VLKEIKNQDKEVACVNADKEELLQKSCPLEFYAKPLCCRVQPTVSHIPNLKAAIKLVFFFKNRVI